MGKFKDFFNEETTAGDIATVDTKLDLVKRPKHLMKGKKCKSHHRLNCLECSEDYEKDDE